MKGVGVGHKFWLEINGKPLLGKGRYKLLKEIEKTNSLKKSCDVLNLSYKTAYNYIKKIENRLGERVVAGKRGGKDAGGSTELTDAGAFLVKKYEDVAK